MVVARKGDRIRLTACCDLFAFYLLTFLMASYLVTGGAGFIGSHLAEELVRRGHRVRVADSLITGKRRNLAHIPGVDFLEGDLADLSLAQRAVVGMDYVLHQAAIPSVPRSVKDPITSNRANIDASLNVLVAARDAGVRRVVYAGSSSAYGNTATLPKHEDMPAQPLSPVLLANVDILTPNETEASILLGLPPGRVTMDEAAGAFDAINGDYQKHSRVARQIAENYFDAKHVLGRVLECALG